MRSMTMRFKGDLGLPGLLLWLSVVMVGMGAGCAGAPDNGAVGTRQSALCNPGNTGGDLGCGCTLNEQCNNFDNDTRLIVCDVPDGAAAGTCLDCTAGAAHPVGCACAADAECATGLYCDVRSCQKLRVVRGDFCLLDSECGMDILGQMTCLPTKHWCGPLPDGSFCDFNSDCLSLTCNGLGVCSSGGSGFTCTKDADCKSPLVCSLVTFQCITPQADGAECTRNAECVNQCNSFSGQCLMGGFGTICTLSNPDSDCSTGFDCTMCGPTYTCRVPGGPCG